MSSSDLPTPEEISSFLAQKLVEERNRDRYVMITVPATLGPLETFLAAATPEMGLIWHPPRGCSFGAAGSAKTIHLGQSDLATVEREIDACWRNGFHHVFPGIDAPVPKFFGGVAFAPSRNDEAPWSEFGAGSFTLPRWTYTRDSRAERAFLNLALAPGDPADFVEQVKVLGEYDAIAAALSPYEGVDTQAVFFRELPTVLPAQIVQQGIEEWRAYIADIQDGIRAGAFQKVVAARRCEISLPQRVDVATLMARLGAELPATTRFAFQRATTTLIGASPELLFHKEGDRVSTEALAGTIRSLGSEFPTFSRQSIHLRNSNKDQREHEFVVRQIAEVLKPISKRVDVPDVPSLRKIGSIIHLLSPIEVETLPSTSAIRVLAALHPTPAVGGAPRAAAVKYILEREPTARGWYTGAVGWIDARGSATFNVAIRSGVVENDGKRAYIYSGAGIVRESDADEEYAETGLKQQPMLKALGWVAST